MTDPRPPKSPRKGKHVNIRIAFLNDTVHVFQVPVKGVGSLLWEAVVNHLQLLEADYFDLQYTNQRGDDCWLDKDKVVLKQIHSPDTPLRFCVKFYTPDPGLLEDELTRYLFALQVRKDLLQGDLRCSDNTAALLASYIVQGEIGDFDLDEYVSPNTNYLAAFKFVPDSLQTEEFINKVMDYHRQHIGESPSEADLNLLDTARKVELYGVKTHAAKDHEGVPLNLAVAHLGVLVFQSQTKINTFSWAKVRKLSFKRKKFLIKLHPDTYGYYKDTVEFFFDSRDRCKLFWKQCIEHHAFFRCQMVAKAPRSKARVVSRGSSFRYSGRTQKQLVEFVRENIGKRPHFDRSTSGRISNQSASVTPKFTSKPGIHSSTDLHNNSGSRSSGSHILESNHTPGSGVTHGETGTPKMESMDIHSDSSMSGSRSLNSPRLEHGMSIDQDVIDAVNARTGGAMTDEEEEEEEEINNGRVNEGISHVASETKGARYLISSDVGSPVRYIGIYSDDGSSSYYSCESGYQGDDCAYSVHSLSFSINQDSGGHYQTNTNHISQVARLSLELTNIASPSNAACSPSQTNSLTYQIPALYLITPTPPCLPDSSFNSPSHFHTSMYTSQYVSANQDSYVVSDYSPDVEDDEEVDMLDNNVSVGSTPEHPQPGDECSESSRGPEQVSPQSSGSGRPEIVMKEMDMSPPFPSPPPASMLMQAADYELAMDVGSSPHGELDEQVSGVSSSLGLSMHVGSSVSQVQHPGVCDAACPKDGVVTINQATGETVVISESQHEEPGGNNNKSEDGSHAEQYPPKDGVARADQLSAGQTEGRKLSAGTDLNEDIPYTLRRRLDGQKEETAFYKVSETEKSMKESDASQETQESTEPSTNIPEVEDMKVQGSNPPQFSLERKHGSDVTTKSWNLHQWGSLDRKQEDKKRRSGVDSLRCRPPLVKSASIGKRYELVNVHKLPPRSSYSSVDDTTSPSGEQAFLRQMEQESSSKLAATKDMEAEIQQEDREVESSQVLVVTNNLTKSDVLSQSTDPETKDKSCNDGLARTTVSGMASSETQEKSCNDGLARSTVAGKSGSETKDKPCNDGLARRTVARKAPVRPPQAEPTSASTKCFDEVKKTPCPEYVYSNPGGDKRKASIIAQEVGDRDIKQLSKLIESSTIENVEQLSKLIESSTIENVELISDDSIKGGAAPVSEPATVLSDVPSSDPGDKKSETVKASSIEPCYNKGKTGNSVHHSSVKMGDKRAQSSPGRHGSSSGTFQAEVGHSAGGNDVRVNKSVKGRVKDKQEQPREQSLTSSTSSSSDSLLINLPSPATALLYNDSDSPPMGKHAQAGATSAAMSFSTFRPEGPSVHAEELPADRWRMNRWSLQSVEESEESAEQLGDGQVMERSVLKKKACHEVKETKRVNWNKDRGIQRSYSSGDSMIAKLSPSDVAALTQHISPAELAGEISGTPASIRGGKQQQQQLSESSDLTMSGSSNNMSIDAANSTNLDCDASQSLSSSKDQALHLHSGLGSLGTAGVTHDRHEISLPESRDQLGSLEEVGRVCSRKKVRDGSGRPHQDGSPLDPLEKLSGLRGDNFDDEDEADDEDDEANFPPPPPILDIPEVMTTSCENDLPLPSPSPALSPQDATTAAAGSVRSKDWGSSKGYDPQMSLRQEDIPSTTSQSDFEVEKANIQLRGMSATNVVPKSDEPPSQSSGREAKDKPFSDGDDTLDVVRKTGPEVKEKPRGDSCASSVVAMKVGPEVKEKPSNGSQVSSAVVRKAPEKPPQVLPKPSRSIQKNVQSKLASFSVEKFQPTEQPAHTIKKSQPTNQAAVSVRKSQPTDPPAHTIEMSQPTNPPTHTEKSQPSSPPAHTDEKSKPTPSRSAPPPPAQPQPTPSKSAHPPPLAQPQPQGTPSKSAPTPPPVQPKPKPPPVQPRPAPHKQPQMGKGKHFDITKSKLPPSEQSSPQS